MGIALDRRKSMKFSNCPKCPGLEQTLTVVPRIFHCHDCGAEVEIWSDEGKAKCSACGNWIMNDRQRGQEDARRKVQSCIEVMEWSNRT